MVQQDGLPRSIHSMFSPYLVACFACKLLEHLKTGPYAQPPPSNAMEFWACSQCVTCGSPFRDAIEDSEHLSPTRESTQ